MSASTAAKPKPKPIRVHKLSIDTANKCVRLLVTRVGPWGADMEDTVVHYWHGAGFMDAVQDAINGAIKEAEALS